ncbi:MAG: response regulator [Myxococcales bacterium]|nr:response regulator [Myxococcales bacterium]
MACILVVEADDDTQEALRGVLAEEGFDVRVAPDGTAAMGHLEADDAPAAILLDVIEPLAFLDRLAQQHDLDAVNVIVMTADSRRIRHPRAVAVLRMPFNIDELLALARKYCN